jgi:predicted AAA+ superfamily ATPase
MDHDISRRRRELFRRQLCQTSDVVTFFVPLRDATGFETAVFSELIKKYPAESVYYWRTKDKKEIDFILNVWNGLLPIEVKLNFEQFTPTAIRYFTQRYQINQFRVVGLNGIPKDERFIYPWGV